MTSGMSSGSGVASTGGGTSKRMRAPSFGLALGVDGTAPSTRTKPAADQLLEPRARQAEVLARRVQRQQLVEPLAGLLRVRP